MMQWPDLARRLKHTALAVIPAATLAACGAPAPEVVVYTAHDDLYSRPILQAFTEATGIAVRPVFDTEASKTTGLVTRLMQEKGRPRCDVFWNNEVAQTILLREQGVLEAYDAPARAAIPPAFKDAEGYWSGFAARARVIIYNTGRIETPPATIEAFRDPQWKGQAAIALPLFGTTATHGAALFAHWGPETARAFFLDLQRNETAILPGNGDVADLVARGVYAFGLTDTDDANGAMEDGHPVRWVLPDQEGLGTLLIPNTVALIQGAPHLEAARKLIDYLLSPEVEAQLAAMRSIQIPLQPGVPTPEKVPSLSAIRAMDVSFAAMAQTMPESAAFFRETFLQ